MSHLAAGTKPADGTHLAHCASQQESAGIHDEITAITEHSAHSQPAGLGESPGMEQPGDTHHLPVPDDPRVKKYVRFFQGAGRETFSQALNRSWFHLPTMMKVLNGYSIPEELVYVVLVESRFNTRAVSPKGAAGCWQLMPGTARRLGLQVSKKNDERFDPIKSTHAAARYLRHLHRQFNSWPLAIAAYNSGALPVHWAMRYHDKENFWDMAGLRGIPSQTAAFVSKVYAAISIAKDLEGHGFERPRYFAGEVFDVVWVHGDLNLEQVAQWIGTSVTELRALNPTLQGDRITATNQAVSLRLPFLTKHKFAQAYQRYLAKDG
jgi:membrane-bound lytic murein transglycosylase D